MLQPSQPMGTPNMAATGPQAPKPQQQGMPAGSLMGVMPSGGIMAPIDKIADAYKGNPQALAQKGISGDLLAQLAKVRLDAKLAMAERELQMQKVAQQDPNQKPVIDQISDRLMQREMDLTKREMQDEQVDTLQQKNAQLQQGQKRLMQAAMNPQQQGIGGLPAPNAAEPVAMAAGGIIAFDGVTDGSYVDPSKMANTTYDPTDPYHRQDRMRSFRDYFKDKYGYDPEEKGILTGLRTGIGSSLGSTSPEYLDLDKYEAMKLADKEAGPRPQKRESGPAPEDTSGPQAGPVADAQRKQEKARTDITPPAPIQNIGGVPGGGGINTALNKALNTQLEQDPQKVAAAEREASYKFMAPDEKDVAARREQLAGITALNRQYFDPDRQQARELQKALAVGPTSFGAATMGNLGRNAARAAEDEYRQQRAALTGEEKGLATLMGDIYAPKKEAVSAGTAAATGAAHTLGNAMSTAGHIRSAEIQAAVSAANNHASMLERQLVRETNDRNTNLRLFENAQESYNKYLNEADKNYNKAAQALVIPGAKPTKEQQAALAQLQQDRDNARLALNQKYVPLLRQAADRAGMDKGLISLIGADSAPQNAIDFSKLPK